MKNWLLVIIWAGLIFLGSCLPGVSVSGSNFTDFLAHKAVHIFEYAVLAVLLLKAYCSLYNKLIRCTNKKIVILTILVICFLYGLSDEWHQSFVSGREAKLRDAFIDLLGGGFGILLLWKLPPKVQKKLLS